MKHWSQTIVTGIALATVSGCELMADLGPERRLAADLSAGSACPAPFPEEPAADDAGDDDIVFTAAVRVIDFGEKGGVGRNIDGVCSRNTEEASCAGKVDQTDAANGIDNVAGKLLPYLDATLNHGEDKYFNSDFQSQEMERGKWSIIGQVRGWNGQANDTQVEFRWYISDGMTGLENTVTPKWDGTDVWQVSPDSVVDQASLAPAHVDANAYIRDWMLVAGMEVERIEIPLSGGRVAFTLRKPTVTGTIVKHPEGYALSKGLITGVWRLDEVFDMLSSFRLKDGSALCKGTDLYGAGKALFCGNADITTDGAVRTAECDAISFGIGFEGFPIRTIGGVHARLPVVPSTCLPGADPKDDRCDR